MPNSGSHRQFGFQNKAFDLRFGKLEQIVSFFWSQNLMTSGFKLLSPSQGKTPVSPILSCSQGMRKARANGQSFSSKCCCCNKTASGASQWNKCVWFESHFHDWLTVEVCGENQAGLRCRKPRPKRARGRGQAPLPDPLQLPLWT